MIAPAPSLCFRQTAICCLLLLGAAVSRSTAQNRFTNPVRITQREGLPDNRVTCMLQDGAGFMWFGTYKGLCRYDGTSIKVYQNIQGDSSSISDNQINSLFYDGKRNWLWIGTQNGLNVLNLYTGRFKVYFFDPEDPHSIPDNIIGKAIFRDRQGEIWIGMGETGLLRYNETTDNFERYQYPLSGADKGERLERIGHITRIAQDLHNASILWIGTRSGLLKFNKYNGSFTRYYADLKDKLWNIRANDNNCLYLSPDGRVLTGSWGGTVSYFRP